MKKKFKQISVKYDGQIYLILRVFNFNCYRTVYERNYIDFYNFENKMIGAGYSSDDYQEIIYFMNWKDA